MARGLKITVGALGVVLCVEGVLDVVLPVQRAVGMGLDECAARAQLPVYVLGASWIATGAWLVAAAREPLRHLEWVKFAITLLLVLLLALSAAVLRGDVPLRRVAVEIGLNVVIVALLLVFYPRAHRAGPVSAQG